MRRLVSDRGTYGGWTHKIKRWPFIYIIISCLLIIRLEFVSLVKLNYDY